MFKEQDIQRVKELEDEWQQKCAAKYGEEKLRRATASDIPVKPVYSPADIESIAYEEIGMPGVYPYTRGRYPLQYQNHPCGASWL